MTNVTDVLIKVTNVTIYTSSFCAILFIVPTPASNPTFKSLIIARRVCLSTNTVETLTSLLQQVGE